MQIKREKMVNNPLTILQVNTADLYAGGAERISWQLFEAYRSLGLKSWLAVGKKNSNDPHVLLIPNDAERNSWARFWRTAGEKVAPFIAKTRGAWQLQTLLYGIGEPQRWLNIQRGYEEFNFPGSRHLLDICPDDPDIVHLHNLHGNYFDLRILPELSWQVPLIITLHDTWLLSGHCAYSFDCERWQSGCGLCPNLKAYPAIHRDGTAFNWKRKRDIFHQARLFIVTPSQWLMNKVEQSILVPAIKAAKVIPNGVDSSIFQPEEKWAVRKELGIQPDVKVLLFVAKSLRSFFKDFQMIYEAIQLLNQNFQQEKLLFIALGEDAPAAQTGQENIRYIPYQKDAFEVARYYQAADLYLHAAYADTFPTTILEALACGTPVVATAVGGIPEQIKSLLALAEYNLRSYPSNEATGILVPPRDVPSMAAAIEMLLTNESLRRQLAENASQDAQTRFSIDKQVAMYTEWYQEVINMYHFDSTLEYQDDKISDFN
jgi:glycosyltransferase involved in cell wall biosynthesis